MDDINNILSQVKDLKTKKTTLINNIKRYSEDNIVNDIAIFIFNNWNGFDNFSDAITFVTSINTYFNIIAKDCYFLSNDSDDFIFELHDEYNKNDDIENLNNPINIENYIKRSNISRDILRLNNTYSTLQTHNHDKTLKFILNSISQNYDLNKIEIKGSNFKYIDFNGLSISCGASYADINWRLSKKEVIYSLNEQGRSQISELISAFIGYKIKYFELLQANNIKSIINEYLNNMSLFDDDNIAHLATKTHPLYGK